MILPILQKWGVTSAVALAKVAETRRIASKVSLRSHLKRRFENVDKWSKWTLYKEKTENMGFGRAGKAVFDTARGHRQSVDYSKCQRAKTGSQIKSNIASVLAAGFSRKGTCYCVSPRVARVSSGDFATVTVNSGQHQPVTASTVTVIPVTVILKVMFMASQEGCQSCDKQHSS